MTAKHSAAAAASLSPPRAQGHQAPQRPAETVSSTSANIATEQMQEPSIAKISALQEENCAALAKTQEQTNAPLILRDAQLRQPAETESSIQENNATAPISAVCRESASATAPII